MPNSTMQVNNNSFFSIRCVQNILISTFIASGLSVVTSVLDSEYNTVLFAGMFLSMIGLIITDTELMQPIHQMIGLIITDTELMQPIHHRTYN